MLISQREYARRKGWSSPYVSKLVHQGKIPTVGVKKEIDPDKADAALAGSKTNAPKMGARQPSAPEIAPSRSEGMPVSYIQARTVHETYKAKKEKLEYEKMLGKLVDIETVERQQSHVNGNIASRLRALPSKLTPQLVGVPTSAKVNAILTKEILQALEELVTIAGNTLVKQ